jgi:riboflavin synthase
MVKHQLEDEKNILVVKEKLHEFERTIDKKIIAVAARRYYEHVRNTLE